MSRKEDLTRAGHEDHAQAARERAATQRLLRLGADALDPRPWRPSPAPPSALDLVQFAVWRNAALAPDDVLSALALLPAARAEIDGLESALLFVARGAGLTWAQMAEAMGFNSPQACQQHYNRLTARQEGGS
ncbi:DNA-binding protein [Actinomadura sp. ATCC 31491]|uniref:DNA-binding protein n=1 Tax=Actinomadura luzonensis TaxID=2805427 RepID=A0ABT0FXH9_9ACTN|nr:DNA-binding protein [Actinomadura luzonensis]MCK2217058.1 DNA-binding protein [Actinomadura luzonensis]